MPRVQVRDLNAGGELSTPARPSDQFFVARGGRFRRPDRIDFAGLSRTITQGLLASTQDSQEDQALGFARLQELRDEALAESASTQEALAKLVSEGRLDEGNNPAFVTGYRRALAREVANRWFTSSRSQVEGNAAQSILPDQEAGVPFAMEAPEKTFASTFQTLRQRIQEINPELASDPWFRRELGAEQARLLPRLREFADNQRKNVRQTAARNQINAELSSRIRKFATGQTDGTDLDKYVTENVHRGGIKDPHAFVFDAVRGAYLSVLNTVGPDGHPVDDAGEQAVDALARMGNIRVDGVAISAGTFSDDYQTLMRQAFVARSSDRRHRDERRQRAFSDFREAWENDPESPWSRIARAPSDVAASAIIDEFRIKGAAAGPWDPAQRFGVPNREFYNEALSLLLDAEKLRESAVAEGAEGRFMQAVGFIDAGNFDAAENIKDTLPADQQLKLRGELQRAREVTGHTHGVVANRWYGELRSLRSRIQTGTTNGDSALQAEVDRKISLFGRTMREQLLAVGPEDRSQLMGGEIQSQFEALRGAIQQQVADGSAAYRDNFAVVIDGWSKNQNMSGAIRKLWTDRKIDAVEFKRLMAQNTAENRVQTKWLEDAEVRFRPFASEIRSIIGNPARVIQTSGSGSTATFSGKFVDAGWITLQSTGSLSPFGGKERPVVTPKGAEAIRSIRASAQRSMDAWFQSDAAVAAKQAGTLSIEAVRAWRSIQNQVFERLQSPSGNLEFSPEEVITPLPAHMGSIKAPGPGVDAPIPAEDQSPARKSPVSTPPAESTPEGSSAPTPAEGGEEAESGEEAGEEQVVQDPNAGQKEDSTPDSPNFDPGRRDVQFEQVAQHTAAQLAAGNVRDNPIFKTRARFMPTWLTEGRHIERVDIERRMGDALGGLVNGIWRPTTNNIRRLTGDSPQSAPTGWGQILQKSSTLTQHAWRGRRAVGAHPYFPQIAMLGLKDLRPKMVPAMHRAAVSTSNRVMRNLLENPQSWVKKHDVEYAYHNAYRFLGVRAKDILDKTLRVEGTKKTIPLEHPEWVMWQLTPFFRDEDELRRFVEKSPNDLKRLFENLAIPHSNESDILDQEITRVFVRYQRDAIRRTK